MEDLKRALRWTVRPWARWIIAWLRLTRPSNSLGAVALLLVAAKPSPWPWAREIVFAILSLWAITVFGYVTNDLMDLPADRLNKPARPLVRGDIAFHHARLAAVLLAGLAVGSALLVRPWGMAPAGAALLALVGYSSKTKRVPLLGNIQIGLMAGLVLLAGAWFRQAWRQALGPAAVVALFITGREVAKTAEDVPGDLATHTRPVATVWGTRAAFRIYALCLVLAAVLSSFVWRQVMDWRVYVRTAWQLSLLGMACLPLVMAPPQAVRWVLRTTKVGYGLGLAALALLGIP